MKILILLFITFNLYGQDRNIVCVDGSCNPDFLPDNHLEKAYFSSLDAGSFNIDDINITIGTGDSPRSLRMSVTNNTVINTPKVTANLSSNSSEFNSADFMLFGDVFSDLNITLNGFSGLNGKSAATICAEKMMAGSNGGYGEGAKIAFQSRRLFDPSISPTKCDYFDLVYLKDFAFSCEEAEGFSEVEISNPVVEVQRWKGKTRCLGMSFNDVCLSKTVKIGCNWKVKYLSPPEYAGTYSTSPADSETKYFTMPEEEYYSRRSDSSFIEYLCDTATTVPGDPAFPNILKNGSFFRNLNGWTLQQAQWYNQKIKFMGHQTQTERPSGIQSITTTPGRKYRVKGSWIKSVEDSHMGSGRITIWNDSARSAENKHVDLIEMGAIDNLYMNSSPSYYSYNYQNLNTNVDRIYTIYNKDDRIAQNCSPPYLTGSTTQFSIVSDSCGSNNLDIGDSCDVTVRSNPTSMGLKTVYLKRTCRDQYTSNTTLSTKIDSYGFQVGTVYTGNVSSSSYPGTVRLTGVTNGATSYSKFCRFQQTVRTCQDNDFDCENERRWFDDPGCNQRSYSSFSYPKQTFALTNPSMSEFPMKDKSEIPSEYRKDIIHVDFTFTAETEQSFIEIGPILRFHVSYMDDISVTLVSLNAGPSVPPIDETTPNVEGELGLGYFDLYNTSYTITSPGYDNLHYTIPPESDWSIQYASIGTTCPTYFNKIKTYHLASHIEYAEDEVSCEGLESALDPTGTLIHWRRIGFDRLEEFGTETVFCSPDNCSLNVSIRDLEKNIEVINPTSGVSGTQQGEGLIFVYDYGDLVTESNNGIAGFVGDNDLPEVQGDRICVKIQDATNNDENYEFGSDPSVYFRKYRWLPLKVYQNGNYGDMPPENNKKVHIFKKIDSSVRYLLKKELF